jgi:putative peptidoglycan lipid II flippase
MGGVLYVCSLYRPQLEAPLAHFHLKGLGAKEVTVLAVCAIAAALYPLVLFAFGGLTMSEIRQALQRGPRNGQNGGGGEPPPDLPIA